MWQKLAAKLGSRSGLAALMKKSAIMTLCVIYRQALAIKAVRFINRIVLNNSRLFKQLCFDINSEHETLFFHMHWLSKENMVSRWERKTNKEIRKTTSC